MTNNILVIGGLGFIGTHIVNELQHNNYNVSIGCRSVADITRARKEIVKIDLLEMSDTDILKIICQYEVIVFAGGVDDRTIPSASNPSFFFDGNVTPCVRLATISKKLHIKKIIIIGSYFSYFHRLRPNWKMTTHHPYVKSRVQQYEKTVQASENKTPIIVLEIPYVFGAIPNKTPLWNPLIKYIDKIPFIFYTKGGTNIISVEQVAKAVVGAIENIETHTQIVVAGKNVRWKQLIQMVSNSLGKKKYVITIPTFLIQILAFFMNCYFKVRKKQPGLDPINFIKIQTSKTYLESDASMQKLNYANVDMQTSIDETVRACNLK